MKFKVFKLSKCWSGNCAAHITNALYLLRDSIIKNKRIYTIVTTWYKEDIKILINCAVKFPCGDAEKTS